MYIHLHEAHGIMHVPRKTKGSQWFEFCHDKGQSVIANV